ncbi:MAG: hypothetical protein ICV78_12010 [Tolypothrix sp. Co-bin9]|nr:hypothetical protein [Tolypothrix sp. Co-bin9]
MAIELSRKNSEFRSQNPVWEVVWDEETVLQSPPAHSIERGRKMLVAVRNPTQLATLLTSDFFILDFR